MKILTQIEFEALPRNELGYKVVSAYTDCTQIKNFGERCIFGECCIFWGNCKIENKIIISYKVIHNIGTSNRALYCFNTEEGYYFQVGCRFEDERSFRKSVLKEYDEDSDYIKAMDFLMSITK